MFVIYAMLGYGAVAMLIAAVILRRVRARELARRQDGFFLPVGGMPPGSADMDAPLLHRVTLRGRPVRFYRSPLVGADFPWAVLRDLYEVATEGGSYTVSAEWVYASNPGLARAIQTDRGVEILLSHWACLELLASLSSDPEARGLLIGQFRECMAEAYVLQWAGLSREEFLALCALASGRPPASL